VLTDKAAGCVPGGLQLEITGQIGRGSSKRGVLLLFMSGNVATLFGFGFAGPAFLWGLGLASLPIIIHFLSRRRYRIIDWAAMPWLLAALRKQRHRIRLEQLLLLLVRTLLVAAIVLAMARPYLKDAAAVLVPGTRMHRIIVLDVSYSMSSQVANQSRLDRAKRVASLLIDSLRNGDAVSIILMAEPPTALIAEPSADFSKAKSIIERLQVTHGGANIVEVLDLLRQVLSASSFDRRQVYFITDIQRHTWSPASDAGADNLRKLAQETLEGAQVTVVDVGRDGVDNLAVTDLKLLSSVPVTSRPCQIAVTVRNFGHKAVQDRIVRLKVDNITRQSKTVTLAPGESATTIFSTTFATSGPVVLAAELEADPLELDNIRWLALDVKDQIDVLVVDGDEPSGRPFESETDYLKVALAPNSGGELVTPFRPVEAGESALLEHDLSEFEAIVIANVSQFTEQEYVALERYLELGGSVVWFMGDLVDLDSYNRILYRDGKGIMPVKLLGVEGAGREADAGIKFNPLNYEHPVIKPFQGAERSGLLTTLVFKYVKAQLGKYPELRVALAYETGDPAIVTCRMRNGFVAVVTTSADTEWTSWPIHYSYVPVIKHTLSAEVRGSGTYL